MKTRTGSVYLWRLRLGALLDEMERDGVVIQCHDDIKLTKDGVSAVIIADSESMQ